MEIGRTNKRASDGKIRIALLYPGTYKEAVSSLGHLITYQILNEDEETVAHRFTLDSPFSIEEGLPLKAYDYVFVSVHYEPQLPKLLSYLSRYGFPLRREEREKRLLLGGPGVWNPLPSSSFADALFIGESEDVFPRVLDLLHLHPEDWKTDGLYSTWNGESTSFTLHDLSFAYSHLLSDNTAYGRFPLFLEVNRGCRFACRFCLIGWTRKPQRNRKLSQVLEIVEDHFARGAEKVVFIGSDVMNYPHIERILEDLAAFSIPFSIPSARIERLTDEMLSILGRGGIKTLTVAPEAADERRKLFIAKPIPNEDVVDIARRARSFGIRRLKLYFVLGFPDSDEKEALSIVNLVREVRKHIPVTGTVSVFVPKPYTPFQHLPMEDLDKTRRLLKIVKKGAPWLDVGNVKRAALQAVLSVGDEQVSELLLRAHKNYNYFYWRRVAREMGLDIDRYIYGPRETPWMEKVRTPLPRRALKEGLEVAAEVYR